MYIILVSPRSDTLLNRTLARERRLTPEDGRTTDALLVVLLPAVAEPRNSRALRTSRGRLSGLQKYSYPIELDAELLETVGWLGPFGESLSAAKTAQV
jgi:hypothetical protein